MSARLLEQRLGRDSVGGMRGVVMGVWAGAGFEGTFVGVRDDRWMARVMGAYTASGTTGGPDPDTS